MEVQQLKQLIKNKQLPNFLIFTGDEWKVQQIYIETIAKAVECPIVKIDSIMDIWRSLAVKSIINTKNIYLLADDKELITTEALYTQVTDRLGDNILILVLHSPDKRLKMLKQYKDSIVEFNPLKSDILKRYIQKEIDLNDRNCEILMEICDYNYGHCLLEIDKIKKYKADTKPTTLQSNDINPIFVHLLDDGTIHIPPRDALWDFIKAFLQNKPKLAYELYQEVKEIGTATLILITNLYNNTKQLLQVQECYGQDIARRTGLSSWQIKNAQECLDVYSTDDLLYLMKLLQKLESGIKRGTIDESICIDYLFANYF